MTLKLTDKQNIVSKVNQITKQAISAIIADYKGINANQINELRKNSRNINVYIKVIRNTLMYRIIKNTSFECLKNKLTGQNIIGFSYKNPGAAARLFKIFSKKNNKLKIKAAAFEGKLMSEEEINYLSTLPSYEESISKLIFTIKEAFGGKLIRTLIALNKKK